MQQAWEIEDFGLKSHSLVRAFLCSIGVHLLIVFGIGSTLFLKSMVPMRFDSEAGVSDVVQQVEHKAPELTLVLAGYPETQQQTALPFDLEPGELVGMNEAEITSGIVTAEHSKTSVRMRSLRISISGLPFEPPPPEKVEATKQSSGIKNLDYAAYVDLVARRIEAVGLASFPDYLPPGIFRVTVGLSISEEGDLERIVVYQGNHSTRFVRDFHRILQAASPFPGFPPALRQSHKRVRIVRSVEFLSSHGN